MSKSYYISAIDINMILNINYIISIKSIQNFDEPDLSMFMLQYQIPWGDNLTTITLLYIEIWLN